MHVMPLDKQHLASTHPMALVQTNSLKSVHDVPALVPESVWAQSSCRNPWDRSVQPPVPDWGQWRDEVVVGSCLGATSSVDTRVAGGGMQGKESECWYVGKLKSFRPATGFGFVECTETHKRYCTDVFIHKNEVLANWRIGQYLKFSITCNSRGQPQARDVCWLPLNDPQPACLSKQAEQIPGTRHIGTLKSFGPNKGYGFIECDDVFAKFMRDVYLDKAQMPEGIDWHVGQVLEFELALNVKGQPQARNVDWLPLCSSHPQVQHEWQDEWLHPRPPCRLSAAVIHQCSMNGRIRDAGESAPALV